MIDTMARASSLSCSLYSMPIGSMDLRVLSCFWAQERNSFRVGRLNDRDGSASLSLFNVNRLRSYESTQLLLGAGQEQLQAGQAALAGDLIELLIV